MPKVKYGVGRLGDGYIREKKVKKAETELESSEVQDIVDAVPRLLDIKSKSGCPIAFRVCIEVGNAYNTPDEPTVAKINEVLDDVKPGFRLS